jgi:type IV secretory pathway TraG/TraD family ATPase VirD4
MMVSICRTSVNIKYLHFVHITCFIYCISLNSINRLFCLMKSGCAFCDVGPEFLNTYVNLPIQSVELNLVSWGDHATGTDYVHRYFTMLYQLVMRYSRINIVTILVTIDGVGPVMGVI